MSTPMREFHNRLRVLVNLDRSDVSFLTDEQWRLFEDNPWRFFIRTNDRIGDQIWEAMQRALTR